MQCSRVIKNSAFKTICCCSLLVNAVELHLEHVEVQVVMCVALGMEECVEYIAHGSMRVGNPF